MLSYEEKCLELAQLREETNDEINYYQKKIEEFKNKIKKENLYYKTSKVSLDSYVLKNYKKDKIKAWVHFLKTERTLKSDVFFDHFFKNTGFELAKSETNYVQIIFKPNLVVNIKKTVDILSFLFDIAFKNDLEDFKINIMSLKNYKENASIYFDDKNKSFFVRQDDKKRASIRDKSGLLFINKIISHYK